MTDVEEKIAIAMAALSILEIVDEDSMGLEDMIGAVKYQANNILQILQDGVLE
jgi:hypothetical protein